MRQFGKVLRFELAGALKNKVFIGVTVFLVAVIAIVMFFPRMQALLGPEEKTPEDPASIEAGAAADRPVLLVCAKDHALAVLVAEGFAKPFSSYDVQTFDGGADALQGEIRAGRAECGFLLEGPAAYTYYVNNLSMYDANMETADAALQTLCAARAMMEGGLTAAQAEEILSIEVEGEAVSLGKDQMANFFYTYVMIFALYMVILLYGQMVATSVATEKNSRAMELLITSVKPVSMMFGKVLASCITGLIQLVAVFGSAVVFYRINKAAWGGNLLIDSIFNIPLPLLCYLLLFFLLGFLIYAFLFGATGSTVSKMEDVNTAVMPVTFLFIIAFFVVIFSLTGNGTVDTPLMRVCSFIPFTSPMAMFTRICMSTVPWYEIALSVAIPAASTVGVGVLSAKIYRVGVLLYGTAPRLRTLLRAMRKA